jgi:hypothetical protein
MLADRKGLDIRKMKTQGAWVSGTAYLTFEDVKVTILYHSFIHFISFMAA